MSDSFSEDIKNHTIHIRLDTEYYRHIICSDGTFNRRFEVLTFPGSLVYTGDMGTFVFQRTTDMFKFFGTGEINPQYWSEKVQRGVNGGRNNDVAEFSWEVLKENILFNMDNEEEKKKFLSSCPEDGLDEQEYWSFLYDDLNLDCPYEYGHTRYTNRFIWCCRAIVWTIKKYEEFKKCC